MTFKRDFKRRIRERQEQTGERYTTARAAVLAQKDLVIELREVTHPGILCPIRVSPALWERHREVLDQLHKILLGSVEGLELMRRVVLHGEPDRPQGSALVLASRLSEFYQRLQQGLRGPGAGGRIVAFDSDGTAVVALLLPRHDGRSLLILSQFVAIHHLAEAIGFWINWRP
jgi:hypothetical protein